MKRRSREDTQPVCPIDMVLSVIACKWTVEIMREVSIKPTRTRQFLAHIPGLSMKCLLDRLKELEAFGVIKRTQYEGLPVKVEYSITEKGRRLAALMASILEFASSEQSTITCSCPIVQQGALKDVCEATTDCPACPRRRTNRKEKPAASQYFRS